MKDNSEYVILTTVFSLRFTEKGFYFTYRHVLAPCEYFLYVVRNLMLE